MCEPAAFEVAQVVADGVVDEIPREVVQLLHHAARSMRPKHVDSEKTVVVGGVDIRRGSRVNLRPRARRTNSHDVFLADGTASVNALLDVDDINRIAVTLEDDPGVPVVVALLLLHVRRSIPNPTGDATRPLGDPWMRSHY